MASCGPGGKKKSDASCPSFEERNPELHKKVQQVARNFTKKKYNVGNSKKQVKPNLGNQSHINPRQMK